MALTTCAGWNPRLRMGARQDRLSAALRASSGGKCGGCGGGSGWRQRGVFAGPYGRTWGRASGKGAEAGNRLLKRRQLTFESGVAGVPRGGPSWPYRNVPRRFPLFRHETNRAARRSGSRVTPVRRLALRSTRHRIAAVLPHTWLTAAGPSGGGLPRARARSVTAERFGRSLPCRPAPVDGESCRASICADSHRSPVEPACPVLVGKVGSGTGGTARGAARAAVRGPHRLPDTRTDGAESSAGAKGMPARARR